MAGKDLLSFIPLAEGADQWSKGAVRQWVDSWWGDWCGSPLVDVGPEQWFLLQKVQRPRLWMPSPAAMEMVMEVFSKDRLAHSRNPHVFVVPCLMTYLWRKNLGKDMDVLFTVQVGGHFWGGAQHEPLRVAVDLPLVHIDRHRGPWLARAMPETRALVRDSTWASSSTRTTDTRDFMSWTGPCVVCGKMRHGGVSIFCRSLCVGQEDFPPCMSAWCGDCYRESPTDLFPRL